MCHTLPAERELTMPKKRKKWKKRCPCGRRARWQLLTSYWCGDCYVRGLKRLGLLERGVCVALVQRIS